MTHPSPEHSDAWVEVEVDHATFWLIDPDIHPGHLPQGSNGLIGADEPGAAAILTGVANGPVSVSVAPRSAPPSAVDLASWEEMMDISVESTTGALRVASPVDGTVPDLPPLTCAGPGTYRVRVHARGRDTLYDLVTDEPVEDYLILAWPAPAAPETFHKASDITGANYRLSAARRTNEER
ncbi:hypothetical protein [Streptomyces sp. B6B3]|uniref:hypothetical protein n=1 Tax=Streptomyces sp. B6B3 TaxID=3153570 RepID=UPI00325F2D6A